MSPDQQFWWNWWVQAFTALGTIGAVLVALFGQRIKALFPPRLHISLPHPLGEWCPAEIPRPDGTRFRTDSRWFHIHVENQRRQLVPATAVQVFLQKIDEFDAAVGQWRVAWSASEVPIGWKNQNVKPPALTIGRPDGCDLFSIIRADPPVLSLYPLVGVFSLNTEWRTACRLLLTLQARSVETDSNILQVEITWNGRWSDDPVQLVAVNT